MSLSFRLRHATALNFTLRISDPARGSPGTDGTKEEVRDKKRSGLHKG
jgi:hypothetical protein